MNTKFFKHTNNKGFSLVEICIVCVVLMVLLIPVFTIMSQGNAGTVQNRNEILARGYAANIIAYFNILPYSEVKELNQNELNALVLENNEKNLKIDLNDLGPDFEKFKKLLSGTTVKVKEFKNQFNNYKVVSVSVKWKEINKKTSNTVSLSGMVSKQ